MKRIRRLSGIKLLLPLVVFPISGMGAENFDDSVTISPSGGNTNSELILNSSSRNWTVESDGDLVIRNNVPNTPFTLESGSPSSAFYVSTEGNIGIGTSTPGGTFSARLHIADPTPEILLDDDDDSYMWSIFANDGGIGFGDETAESLPFFIEAGLPNNAFYLSSAGFLGIGTTSPDNKFHVQVDDSVFGLPFIVENVNGINFSGFRLQIAVDSWIDFNNSGGNFRINADQNPGAEFEVRPSGNATLSGTLTENSDVNAKQDIEPVYHQYVLDRVMQLPISEWSYIDDPTVRHIGPMAQDFHRLFSLGDNNTGIASLDTSGVALAAIQGVKREKDREIAELAAEKEQEISALRQDFEKLVAEQNERILQLEMALMELSRTRSETADSGVPPGSGWVSTLE